MKRRKTLLAVLLSLVGSVLASAPPGRPALYGFSATQQELPACGTYCGTERWSVKTLSDADRDRVDFSPKEATVGWLVSQERPDQAPADERIGPIERQTYKVRARLISYKLEQDRDFHIVIADVEDSGKTMIAEIPSPDCAGACASGRTEEFRKARAALTALPEEFARNRGHDGRGLFCTLVCAGLAAFVITAVLPGALWMLRFFWLKIKTFSVQVPLTEIEFGPSLLVIAFRASLMLV
jgi:hypothetical protein